MFKKRILNILELLLKTENYISVAEISSKIGYSIKTIRNDLQELEVFLNENNFFLDKKPARGIKLKKILDVNKTLLLSKIEPLILQTPSYVRQKRILNISMELLVYGELRIQDTMKRLYSSRSTISNDLNEVEKIFKGYKIYLVRNRNSKTSISAKERYIRSAIFDLITQSFDFNMFKNLLRELHKNKLNNEKILGKFELLLNANIFVRDTRDTRMLIELLLFISKCDLDIFKDTSFDSYANIVLFTLISVYRNTLGKKVNLSDEFIDFLDQIEYRKTQNEVFMLLDKISNKFYIEILKNDRYYIQFYFITLSKHMNDKCMHINDRNSKIFLENLNDVIYEICQVDIEKDFDLYARFKNHFNKVLIRDMHNIKIVNPIKEDIAKNYSQSYNQAIRVVESLKRFFINKISDDEISYIAILIEYSKSKHKKNYKVILICFEDINIAYLMREKILENIDSLDIDILENFNSIYELSLSGYDFMISTREVVIDMIPTVIVNPIILEKDFQIIRKFLKKL